MWERSFFVTAVAFTAVGFVVFADHPNLGAGHVLARAGATAYLFGGIVSVVAETIDLTSAAVTCTPCSTAAPTATASHSPKRPDRIRHRNCVPDHFGRGGERCSSGSP